MAGMSGTARRNVAQACREPTDARSANELAFTSAADASITPRTSPWPSAYSGDQTSKLFQYPGGECSERALTMSPFPYLQATCIASRPLISVLLFDAPWFSNRGMIRDPCTVFCTARMSALSPLL